MNEFAYTLSVCTCNCHSKGRYLAVPFTGRCYVCKTRPVAVSQPFTHVVTDRPYRGLVRLYLKVRGQRVDSVRGLAL